LFRLAEWLELVLHLYGGRVLPFALQAARIAGKLSDLARANGDDPGFADVAIAATACEHGLTVLTGNLRHFVSTGVPALNPFVRLP
jgi:predicted nucleic acid-binding protein